MDEGCVRRRWVLSVLSVFAMATTAYLCLALLVIFSFAALAEAKGLCLQYTWLGPGWQDSATFTNDLPILAKSTCQDLNPRRVPCVDPIVITAPGTELPHGRDLLQLFKEKVQCVAGGGEVCVTSSFHFRNQVVNVTSYCTHVTIDSGSSLEDGCEAGYIGAYTNKVCACTPDSKPCNDQVPNRERGLLANLWLPAVAMSLLFAI